MGVDNLKACHMHYHKSGSVGGGGGGVLDPLKNSNLQKMRFTQKKLSLQMILHQRIN